MVTTTPRSPCGPPALPLLPGLLRPSVRFLALVTGGSRLLLALRYGRERERGPCYDVGVESRSQSQEPRCLRILPCPSLSRPLPAMIAGPPEAGLAARVAAGPGAWEDEEWLAVRAGRAWLNRCWPAGSIAATAGAEHAHRQERALNAEATARAWSPGAVPGPGLRRGPRPGLRYAGPASQARHPGADRPGLLQGPARHGEAPARAMFAHDAARDDIPAGPDGTAFGLEITQIDGTTLELFSDPLLRGGRRSLSRREPLPRLVGLLPPAPAGGRPPSSAATWTGRTPWPTACRTRSAPASSNLADRGFFSMDRWIRFSAPAPTCYGASRTARSPSRSGPSRC